ncbi:MAG: ATP-binding cassette domain-containing protein, partial [Bacteroidota bacterium]
YGLYAFDSKKDLIILLGIFALAAYRLMPSVNRLMQAILNIRGHQYTFEALEPIRDFRTKPEVPQVGALPFFNQLSIDKLRFRYPSKDNYVLDDIEFTVRKGETLGIIGRSGSGKTTLLNIMLGFLKPESGEIRVDNQALKPENVVAWRSLIGYVQQDIYLTDGTLAENIAFGVPKDQIDYDRVERVVRQASLWEVVGGLDEGIHSKVGEKGSSLSGGQKQRVGIARALYSGAQVLLFDEATSALDNETELEITEAIHRLSGGDLTMLIVAHRHTTLKYCDRILNIEQGRLKESLTYQELMER